MSVGFGFGGVFPSAGPGFHSGRGYGKRKPAKADRSSFVWTPGKEGVSVSCTLPPPPQDGGRHVCDFIFLSYYRHLMTADEDLTHLYGIELPFLDMDSLFSCIYGLSMVLPLFLTPYNTH